MAPDFNMAGARKRVTIASLALAEPQFDRTYPWAVKSLRQSRLLTAWLEQGDNAGSLPQLANFTALNTYPEQSELTIYDVVREHATPRYRIVREGASFRKVFARVGQGRFLDDVLPPQAWRSTRANYDECVRRRLPIYCAFSVIERTDQNVIYERLLLPFGARKSDVAREGAGEVIAIVTSLKTTSWTDATAVAIDPGAREPKYSFRAVIGRDGPANAGQGIIQETIR